MPADYSSYKPVFSDTANYPGQINNFIDAVQTDMNTKLDSSAVTYKAIATKTANYTVGANDSTIEIDATVSNVTITLPAATPAGRILVFRRVDSYGYRALIGTIHELFVKGEFATFQSNGTAWVRIG